MNITIKMILLIVVTASFQVTADLPPHIEADRLLIQAKESMDSGDYNKAVNSFEKIMTLSNNLPAPFYFHYGKALASTKQYTKAKNQIELYLEKAGRNGEFYQSALSIYSTMESGLAAKKEKDRLALIKWNAERELERITLRATQIRDSVASQLYKSIKKLTYKGELIYFTNTLEIDDYNPCDIRGETIEIMAADSYTLNYFLKNGQRNRKGKWIDGEKQVYDYSLGESSYRVENRNKSKSRVKSRKKKDYYGNTIKYSSLHFNLDSDSKSYKIDYHFGPYSWDYKHDDSQVEFRHKNKSLLMDTEVLYDDLDEICYKIRVSNRESNSYSLSKLYLDQIIEGYDDKY